MITENKITEIFCLADDFCKYFSSELKKYQLSDGKKHRNKPGRLSDASNTILNAVCLQAPTHTYT